MQKNNDEKKESNLPRRVGEKGLDVVIGHPKGGVHEKSPERVRKEYEEEDPWRGVRPGVPKE